MQENSQLLENKNIPKKNSTAIGNIAEEDVIQILQGFSNVKQVWKDTQNSKFDIYYILDNESVTRGLQVKFMSKNKNRKNGFSISDINGYNEGMLMVALNKEYGIGLAYLHEAKHNKIKSAYMSISSNARNEFSKILLKWDDFLIHLKTIITQGTVVTAELFKNSMAPRSFIEYESIERFRLLCEKYGWKFERNTDTGSVTDVYVDTFKIQMKYTNRFVVTTGRHRVSLHKTAYKNNKKSNVSYEQGDNDYYIIEMGCCLGEFLIISEKLLIEKGFISINKQKALIDLTCYKQCFDDKLKIKHWTQNSKHWISEKQLQYNIKLTDF